jgi:hypothetical protein
MTIFFKQPKMFSLFLDIKLKHNDIDIESTMKNHQSVLIKKNLSVNNKRNCFQSFIKIIHNPLLL